MTFDLNFALELLGFLLNLVYLYYIIQQKAVAWIWGFLASALFLWICFKSQLYIQAGLYFFYLGIAFYGLLAWKIDTKSSVQTMTKNVHMLFILTCSAAGFLLGFLFSSFTNQQLPYLDGIISAFSVGTTLLIVSKQRENWLYWIVINLAAMYLYFSQDLNFLTATSFVLMLVAMRGYKIWQEQ